MFQIARHWNACEDLACKRGFVVYPGKERHPIEKNVFALPVTDLRRIIDTPFTPGEILLEEFLTKNLNLEQIEIVEDGKDDEEQAGDESGS